GAVAHVLRYGPNLVERRRERDDPVAGHGAVCRPEADIAAECRGLLARAPGIGAECPGREPARDRRGGTAAGTARHARRVPGVVRWAERGVLGRRAHRELVGVRLPEQT